MLRARGTKRRKAPVAREIPIPLPTSGLFVDAKVASISGLFAAELNNFRTDGVMIELRKQQILGAADQLVLQRVPFEFGATPRYINLRSIQAECNGAILTRQFNGNAMVGYISSNALIVDGLDMPVRYDGTAFQTALFTTSTGVGVNTLDGVIVHHDRPFFWKRGGNLEFYYGDVGAVMGPLVRFPLDRLGNITGNIVSMASVTLDAGQNLNDALAIFTSTGQIVVYEGLDPSDSDNWNLSTRLQVAPPLSRFGLTRVGGDMWVLTATGIVSMSDSLARGSLALVNSIARPISDEILKLAKTDAEWQLHTAADGSQIIINYYTPEASKQFIWQPDSNAWSTSDYPARLWHNLNLATEFTTGLGRLGRIEFDEVPTELIEATWHTSWFQAGSMAEVAYVRPVIIADGPLTVDVTVLRDYQQTAADIAQNTQTVTIDPELPADPGGRVALDQEIAIGLTGDVFQIRMKVTAEWAQIVQLKAAML